MSISENPPCFGTYSSATQSEDKDTVARPLAMLLEGKGLRVWIDEQHLARRQSSVLPDAQPCAAS
jgi:hypothetical protein